MTLTKDVLIGFVQEKTGLDTVEDAMPLFSTGALDSVSQLDLMLLIEEKTGITIGQADVTLENMDSIERILKFVETKQGV